MIASARIVRISCCALLERRLVGDLIVGDARHARRVARDHHPRIHEPPVPLEPLHVEVVVELDGDGAELHDAVAVPGEEARGLRVERDDARSPPVGHGLWFNPPLSTALSRRPRLPFGSRIRSQAIPPGIPSPMRNAGRIAPSAPWNASTGVVP